MFLLHGSLGTLLAQQAYQHFEARHVHSIALTPDGSRLLALNSPDARLCMFDISDTTNPILIAEIPVGLEPVSLRCRSNNEAWVVNEVSDGVSVVNLDLAAVIDTLRTPDEPADVVFASGKAFVTSARSNALRVFDAATRASLGSITLTGNHPRALVANAAGTKVYAAFQLSGNKTTVLPYADAPAQPSPTNAALPAPPRTALIVPTNDSRIQYTVLDNDVAEIDVSSQTVDRYFSNVGTNLFDLAIHPTTGALWVANTESLNLIRFEPVLRGHFADHRLSTIALPGATVTTYDLNPGINYTLLPNPSAQATALAQPTAIVFAADGSHGWVAAFNSDRVAKISSSGEVLSLVDVRPMSANGARGMRGPRALALSADASRLFVLNKLSNTISVVDTTAGTVIAEVATGSRDPMPANVKEGRGFLYDARLSGNGVSSCAVCHLDADRDGIAWDLGDPGGTMTSVIGYNNSIHETTPKTRVMHPMKGPMVTQTLKGFEANQIFHWRGDRPTIQSFDVTYRDLMAGPVPAAQDMDVLADYLNSIRLHPNPNRTLSRALPSTFNGGNPTNGHALFIDHLKSHCMVCHTLPTGSDNNVDLSHIVDSSQPVKTPHLRTVYQRSNFNRSVGAVNVTGFGLLKDGTGNELATAHFYDLAALSTLQEFKDVDAYVQCFDTGTAPAVGYCLTVTTANRANSTVLSDLATLQSQAVANCNLVVRGLIGNRQSTFLYVPSTQTYVSDNTTVAALTQSALLASLNPGDSLTFLGTLAGTGERLSIDRNTNGVRNAQESNPTLSFTVLPDASTRVQWPVDRADWVLEWFDTFGSSTWKPVTLTRTVEDGFIRVYEPPSIRQNFYRLRRLW